MGRGTVDQGWMGNHLATLSISVLLSSGTISAAFSLKWALWHSSALQIAYGHYSQTGGRFYKGNVIKWDGAFIIQSKNILICKNKAHFILLARQEKRHQPWRGKNIKKERKEKYFFKKRNVRELKQWVEQCMPQKQKKNQQQIQGASNIAIFCREPP